MEKEENILGYEKIGKLLRKFAIPSIIALVVNSLYNIVDQIFIGWGVGYLGNGATNVVFPLTMICLAFALMFGDGTSAYLSLKLGENKKDEAKKGVAIFSLEMPKQQLVKRMLCSEAEVDTQRITSGHMQPKDWEKLMDAMTNFAIAEKDGDLFISGYYMGRVHSYLDVLGGYTMLNSPWYGLWRQVFVSTH